MSYVPTSRRALWRLGQSTAGAFYPQKQTQNCRKLFEPDPFLFALYFDVLSGCKLCTASGTRLQTKVRLSRS